jgi:hypothetical protein
MYIERKTDGLSGPARIGRVKFSRTGTTVYYGGRTLQKISGGGFKSNYFDTETNEEYWVSGCKKRGGDSLYGGTITIDEDVREEYWTKIRGIPQQKSERIVRCNGKQ